MNLIESKANKKLCHISHIVRIVILKRNLLYGPCAGFIKQHLCAEENNVISTHLTKINGKKKTNKKGLKSSRKTAIK